MYKTVKSGNLPEARKLSAVITEEIKSYREKCPENAGEAPIFLPFLYDLNKGSEDLKNNFEKKNSHFASVIDSDIQLLDEDLSSSSWYEGGFDPTGVIECVFNGFLSDFQF